MVDTSSDSISWFRIAAHSPLLTHFVTMWISLQLAFPEKDKKDTKMELVLKALQTSGISHCSPGLAFSGGSYNSFYSLLLVISPSYLIA